MPVGGQQRRDKDSRGQGARETTSFEYRDPEHRTDVSLIASHRDRLYLAIGQSLLFPEGVGLPSVPVEHSLIERSHPKVGFCSRERRDVKIAQGWMEHRDFLSVVEQDTALPGSNQQMSGGGGQDRCDGACTCVLGKDLPEGAAVEGEQSILCGGDDQPRFL